ncbi:MAG TPA: HAMP domain-containing sensor histidine kinase [Chloroflexota bacterium]|jgi:two-component system OmpR family sensor kinase
MRTRLAVGVALILAVTLVAFGAVLVTTVQATLIHQIDDRILGAAALQGPPRGAPAAGAPSLGTPPPGGPPPGAPPPGAPGPGAPPPPGRPPPGALPPPGGPAPAGRGIPPPPPRELDPLGRVLALYVYAPDGTLLLDAPSGSAEQPDAPPRLPPIPSAEADRLLDRIVTLPAVDGSLQYRVLLRRGPSGELRVTAGTLATVDATLARLVQVLLLAGAGALAASALASWWLIHRGLRPIDQMLDTAAAIAAGDLSRRVTEADPKTELGRLGLALNQMLGKVEQAMQARAESEARLRRFVADAAHELRTPLTALRGYADLYWQGAASDPATLQNAMQRIRGESVRMARLVDDLLLLARLDHQRGLDLEPVDLVTIVREAATDFAIVAPDRPLSQDLDGAAIVCGDRLRLRQVVDNLLANARIHTPPGTPVRLSARRNTDQVGLTVADEGPGLSPEQQAHVFDRFWRADPSRVRRTGGTGLGLAIVASIVEAHDGAVEVASAPGQGAAFTVRLPLAESQAALRTSGDLPRGRALTPTLSQGERE